MYQDRLLFILNICNFNFLFAKLHMTIDVSSINYKDIIISFVNQPFKY
jgi:hypothetical protein